jgi:hypothetical protein
MGHWTGNAQQYHRTLPGLICVNADDLVTAQLSCVKTRLNV